MAIPVFIVANQRSGTNFLRHLLCSTGLFTDLNEIFQAGSPALYWDFFIKEVTENPDLARPSRENRVALFDKFMHEHVEIIDTKYVLVDIKYNSTHNLNCEFQQLSNTPFLMKLIENYGGYVLHLVRNNSLEVHLSNVLANKSAVYTAFKDSEIKHESVKLDPKAMVSDIRKHQMDISNFRKWINDMNLAKKLEISYEDLVEINHDSSCICAEQLKSFFDLGDAMDFEVKTKKIAKTPAEVVENFDDEVKPALFSSKYSRFAV